VREDKREGPQCSFGRKIRLGRKRNLGEVAEHGEEAFEEEVMGGGGTNNI